MARRMIPIGSRRDLDDDQAEPDYEFISAAALALAAELRREVHIAQDLG